MLLLTDNLTGVASYTRQRLYQLVTLCPATRLSFASDLWYVVVQAGATPPGVLPCLQTSPPRKG